LNRTARPYHLIPAIADDDLASDVGKGMMRPLARPVSLIAQHRSIVFEEAVG
jgi:hypothetical protein